MNAGSFNRALTLASAQQGDRIQPEQMLPETEFGDMDEQASVLDLGREQPSYVFREPRPEPPMAGGGLLESPLTQAQEQRAAAEDMRRTQQQFVGAEPDMERAEPKLKESSPTSAATALSAADTRAEADQTARAQALALQQAQTAEQARQQAGLDQTEAQKTQTQTQVAKQQQMQQLRRFVEGAELGNVVDSGGLTLITYAARVNLRLANKLLFKNDILSTLSLSDPSEQLKFADVIKVGTVNSALFLSWLLLPPMVIITAIIIFILLFV